MTATEVVQAYEQLWSDAGHVRRAAYRCGGVRRPRNAGDHLGFDLLNGGLAEVWALAERLGLSPDSRALELGCGIGGPARFLAERSRCRIVGLDVTRRQLTIARELTRGLDVEPQLEFVLGDARQLPFEPESFTHVYSIEAFVHVPDKAAALAEAYRVLRRGGTICIQDPVHDPELEVELLHRTLHPLTPDDYVRALSEAGFGEIDFVDRTAEAEVAYRYLLELVGDGPISPRRVRSAFARVHPGLRPPLHRFLAPGRLPHVLRYVANRHAAATDLLGTEERVEGVRRMCDDIVSGFERGAVRLYLFSARKP